MGNVRTEVATHNAMPSWVVFLVKLLLNKCCDILLDVVFLKSLASTVYCILLHVLRHVSIFDHCLAFSHFDTDGKEEKKAKRKAKYYVKPKEQPAMKIMMKQALMQELLPFDTRQCHSPKKSFCFVLLVCWLVF
jgi:hypothetical protein